METFCTTSNMRKHLCILLLFAVPLFVWTQEEIQRERTTGEPVFFETHFIAAEKDSFVVETMYRLRQDVFVFTRSPDAGSNRFTCKGEVVVEILDSTGSSVVRNIRELFMESDDNSQTYLRTRYVQGKFSFRLKPGKYTALLRAEDKESKRQLPDIRRPLHIQTQKKILSTVLPVQFKTDSTNTFVCFNIGGDIFFSQDFALLFLVNSYATPNVRYTLKRVNPFDDEKETIVKDTAVISALFPSSTVAMNETGEGISASVIHGGENTVFSVPVHGKNLKQGRYEIEIFLSDSQKITTALGTRWLDMPYSLMDLDIATLPLQFIMTKDDYSNLRSGSRETRIHKFEEFWKKKDPTTETAYNEMMAEFYRRADYAMVTYRSLKEPNGSLTDRGKIFILYGKPTSTERILNPDGAPKEIWKYYSLNKTFIFEDPSKQGNYKLAESK